MAVFSLAGAPGVTTLAMALATAWPMAEPVCVVEADLSGGDIAAWWRLPVWPGLVDLAAASRSGQDQEDGAVGTHTQVLPGGLRVCVAPSTADRTAGAVDLLAHNPKALTAASGTTVVDLGRVAPHSAAAGLLESCDNAVLVTTGDIAQLKRVKDSAAGLFVSSPRVGLVVVGGRGSTREISAAVGMPVWGHIPTDPKAAAFLAGQAEAVRVDRRPLIKAARDLARALLRHEEPSAGVQAALVAETP
nr:hypothetical protein [Nocardiopsis sp. NRRL B-16309]